MRRVSRVMGRLRFVTGAAVLMSPSSDEGQGMNEVWKIAGETVRAHKVGDVGMEGGCRNIYE